MIIIYVIYFSFSSSFSDHFLLHQTISLNSLDQFLSFTDNFMVMSFEKIITVNVLI